MSDSEKVHKTIEIFSKILDQETINYANDFFENGEYLLALDTICEYIYENDIDIDDDHEMTMLSAISIFGNDAIENYRYFFDKNQIESQNTKEPYADNSDIDIAKIYDPEEFVKQMRNNNLSDIEIVKQLRQEFKLDFESAMKFL